MGNCIQDEEIENQDLVYIIIDDHEEEYISFVQKLHELTKQNGRLIADIGGKLAHRDVNFQEIKVVKWAMQGMQKEILLLNKLSKLLNDTLVETYDEYKKKITEAPVSNETKNKKIINLSMNHSIDDITVDSVLLSSETVTDPKNVIKEEDADEFFRKAITEIPDNEDITSHIEKANNLLRCFEEESENTEPLENQVSQMSNENNEIDNGIPLYNNITKSKETKNTDIIPETYILPKLQEGNHTDASTNYEQDTNIQIGDVNTTTVTKSGVGAEGIISEATNNLELLPQADAAYGDGNQIEIDLSQIKKDEECDNESIYSHGTDIVPDILDVKKEDEFTEVLPNSCRVLIGDVDSFQICNEILPNDAEYTNDHSLLDSIRDDDSIFQNSSGSNYDESDEEIKPELCDVEIEDERDRRVSTDLQMNVAVTPPFNYIMTRSCEVRIRKDDTDNVQKHIDQKIEIERLLDLRSLKRKRKTKRGDTSVSKSNKITKKSRELNDSVSSSCSNSSVADSDLHEYNSDYQSINEADSKIIDDDFILDNIRESDSDSSSGSSDDEVAKKKSKHGDVHVLPKRNALTSAWKKDPLLTCSLSNSKEKQKTSIQDDVTVSVDINSSDSSDIEILCDDQQVKESPEATVGNSSKGKGRRNIRAVCSDLKLSHSTVIANTQEKERIGRLRMKHTSPGDEDIVIGLRLDDEIVVHHLLSARLKKHQKEGVKFMWDSCYESVEVIKKSEGVGCILAHCMGLGKTFQIISLLHTLFVHPEQTRTNYVLILCPISTIMNWKNEFDIAFDIVGAKDFKVYKISDSERVLTSKINMVNTWLSNKGVLIMGYECFLALSKQELPLLQKALLNPGPDLVVCDEGHLLKNGNATRSKMIKMVKTKRKIILTGTPMQNNLREYYHMVQIVKPNLLGTLKEYTNRFVNPIINGQYGDSTKEDIQIMKKRSHVLHKVLKDTVQRVEGNELCLYLPPIKDYVLIIPLHDLQRNLYKKAMESIKVNREQKKLFMHYYQLMMIWTHPVLLQMQEKATVRSRPVEQQEEDDAPTDEVIVTEEMPNGWWQSIVPSEMNLLIYSPKFQILFSIIRECMQIGDKLLVFSSLLVELDAIELFLKQLQIDYLRMDGNVSPDGRESLCRRFQNSNIPIFILSHKVGGLGLNLTAANRVVLMDVSWNPAVDSQSIFRIFRFGQTKPCFVYRLVSKGTMEEVVYERAITKQATASRVVDDAQISRHYKSEDLLAMYRCNVDPLETPTTVFRIPSDNILAEILKKNKALIHSYHEMESLLKNLPDEELNEEEINSAWDEYNNESIVLPQQVPHLAVMPQLLPSCSNMFNQFMPRNSFNFTCNNTLPLNYNNINKVIVSPVPDARNNNLPPQRNPNCTITDGEIIELD
ncbi:PREDICTED: transcriptional regulator ATRX homolog isoform X2 [Nicrophorus vespilloides]|nr:PREDICTED: transcriptional regulator ATRX homolog isoform X2 [Nicrophorus vespilloides]